MCGTDRYHPLSSFSQKLRFLIDIQIAIFDKFHSRLHSSLEAYLTLTSTIARTVQGVSKEEQAELDGLGGIERLCRVYGSAEYLEKKMRDWSDDVFFLDMWDELQDRARENTNKNNIVGSMTIEDVAERTSSMVGSQNDNTGALFDETAGAYKRLRVRTESIMQETLIHHLRESLHSYGRIKPWSSLNNNIDSSAPNNATAFNLTAELDATVQQLSSYLAFLSAALAPAPLRRITMHMCLAIQTFLWDNILFRNSFSTSGIAQFTHDVSAIWIVIDRHVGEEGQGALGMRKLKEAFVLLALSADRRRGEQQGDGDDGRATESGGSQEEIEKKEAEVASHGLGLWDVEKRLFLDNESGRKVLDELGLEILTESEARHVLERRIDFSIF